MDPMEVLKLLIPRTINEMTIPLAQTQDIIKIINKSKGKNSTGIDDISMKTIKKL